MSTPPPPSPAPKRQYLYGLDVLRAVAALFIVYRHFMDWTATRDLALDFRDAVNDTVASLRLLPNLGMVGLSSLFLISGLVISYVTEKETPGQFLVRRAFRLLPAFWVAVVISWLLVLIEVFPGGNPAMTADANALIGSLTLANHFLTEQNVVLPVAWTLTLQFAFYLFTAAMIRPGRDRPWLGPLIAGLIIGIALALTMETPTATLNHLRTMATFLPVLFIGQCISLVRSGRLRPSAGIAVGAGHYLLFIWGGLNHETIPYGDPVERTVLLMTLLTVLLLGANGGLARSRAVREVAKRTYSIFLIHMPVGFPILEFVSPHAGAGMAVVAAILVSGVCAELLYRLVELPVHDWYRRRERDRHARRRDAAPAGS
ncbi:peptidoglycan/LPS O-acetylase OafA/YrhL [Actinoalloteichus hoggarensis]|uniref:Acyltransferase family protein n=1 Tax=Actinoalloteichus hoggarensis TaxID=1470176 RepID=A0A221VW48_9PSEU|nr:acyltransferase [Actinoalloteichus hoggarensis]ASO17745.1 Acyltransferase family protein [Actinoalloteichus hoggarensis]MBB5922872.1 peptidoglycan/LPS O-acetylase OafA/YrhL [Actinoalloteichus hoggarensis]